MQKNSDSGNVAITSSSEKAVRKMAHMFVGSPEVAVSVWNVRARKRRLLADSRSLAWLELGEV